MNIMFAKLARHKTALFIGAALSMAAFAGITAISRARTPAAASASACAVYAAFYETLADQKAKFFSPTSVAFPKVISAEAKPRIPPISFEHDTGEFETIGYYADARPVQKPVRQSLHADVSQFFDALWIGANKNIKSCFKTRNDRPAFHQGRYRMLHLREKLMGRDDLGIVTVWRLSPVGISDDGARALLYAEYYCGGNCGGGLYYLFENKDGRWVQIGDRRVWVS